MRSARVAVIGAGPAGLSAALALQDRGHVATVFEKDQRVGGECLSIPVGCARADVGAVVVAPGGAVAALARRMGRPLLELNHDKFPSLATLDLQAIFGRKGELARLAADLIRFDLAYHEWRWRDARTGSPQVEDRSSLVDHLEHKRLARLLPMMRAFLSAYGYGYAETTAASWFLTYYGAFRNIILRLQRRCLTVAGGYDALWQDVAAKLNVVPSADVSCVRRGAQVTIMTQAGTFAFDAVVFACPPGAILNLLDATDDEHRLLSRVSTNRYASWVFGGRGTPGCCVHLPAWCVPEEAGRPMLWYRPVPGEFCQTWSLPRVADTPEAAEIRVRRSAQRIGADIGATIARRDWDYFPHFTLEDMAAGARQELRSWQGRGNVFYVGELFSFSSVENVVAHAQRLMRASFPAAT